MFSLLSRNLDRFHGIQAVVPFVHRRDKPLRVESHLPVIIVSLSFSPGSRLGLVFQSELVQVSALFFCPPLCLFRWVIRVLFLKSFKNRLELFVLRSTQTHLCLVVITLFLRPSASRTARCPVLYDDVGTDSKSNFSFVINHIFSESIRQCPHVQCTTPSGQYSAQDEHCVFAETPKFAVLDITLFVDDLLHICDHSSNSEVDFELLLIRGWFPTAVTALKKMTEQFWEPDVEFWISSDLVFTILSIQSTGTVW